MPRLRPEGRRAVHYYPQYTEQVLKEIAADEADPRGWWHPKSLPSNDHKIFDRALMKFLNGNLNYSDLKNVVIHANDPDPYWNAAYPNTIQLCRDFKALLNEPGPFGRMCLWKIVPGHDIALHTDNFRYHGHITRWVYFLNLNDSVTEVTFAGERIRSSAGYLVELQPKLEAHFFKNNSDQDWYFLVFDTWDVEALKALTPEDGYKDYQKDPRRLVYVSHH